jgi:ABC-type glycerol-3-phosphate transport system substrate-binding protein
MKQRIALRAPLAVAALTMMLAVAGCGGDDKDTSTSGTAAAKEGPVTISFVGTQPPEFLEPVVEAFEKSHQNIKVRYESVPFESLSAVIAQRVGGDTGDIDVYYADAPRNPSIVDKGYAMDLTGKIGDLAGKVPESSIETATIDGKLWTVPMRTSTQVLYYNADLLNKAGITPPSTDPDKRVTWEELRDLAAKAQKAGAKWGYVDDQVSRYYQFQPLPESIGGGSGLNDDGTEADLVNPKFVEAASWWASLYADKLAPRGVAPDQTKPIFSDGDAAFMPGGPWWIPEFAKNKKLKFGIAAYPRFANGEAVTPTDSEHLAVNPHTKNPDAAIEFVKFVTLTKEGALAMAHGLAVPTANLEAQPTHLKELESTRPELKGFAELAEYEMANTAAPRPFSVGYVQFEDIIGKALEDIRSGADVQPRLAKAQDQVEAAFSRIR